MTVAERGMSGPNWRPPEMAVMRCLLGCAALLAAPALAESTVTLTTPVGLHDGNKQQGTQAVDYVIPDLPVAKPPTAEQKAKFFTIRPSLVVLIDWDGFNQDANSVAQVGVQQDDVEIRALRLQFLGAIGHDYKVNYQVSGEYKGFDGNPDTTWQLTDLSLSFPIGDRTRLILGKTKQPFIYEMVGDAANLPASERVLSPFFVSRNTGARFLTSFGPAKRGTFSLGVYNDDWDIQAAERRGWDFAARLTGLVWDQPEGNRYLHIGLGWRHVASAGTLRYKGRPGSNVSSNFVDTGSFAADSAAHFGLEGLLGLGPVSFLGEYVEAQVDAPTAGNPNFSGWYIAGSWVLTGESRPYDRNVGYARRVIPNNRWGAPELVFRYSDVDLNDRQVRGGRFQRTDLGVNWWATTRWKFGAVWGRVWLDRKDLDGVTDTFLTRAQWVY